MRKPWLRSELQELPDYILLTGGASQMEFIPKITQQVFEIEDHQVVTELKQDPELKHDPAPQTAVASGLARLGRWEYRCQKFEDEVKATFTVERLNRILRPQVPKTYFDFLLGSLVALLNKILPGCIDDWRSGKIEGRDGLIRARNADEITSRYHKLGKMR